jgi:hypothetical protein
MTDTLNPAKVKALELAQQSAGTPDDVVKRAHAYLGFLSGSTAAAPAGAAAGKPAATAPAGGKPAAAPAGGKPAAAATKPAEGKPTAAATKPAAEGKPAAAPAGGKPAAAGKPAGAGATGAAVASDTKAPGGTYTYADVVAKLREVQNDPDLGRDKAFAIMAGAGGGVKSVRDLKPVNYDAVVTGCNNALNGEGDNGGEGGVEVDALGGEIEDPTASAPRNDDGT